MEILKEKTFSEKTLKIRALNEIYRGTFLFGQIVFSDGVKALSDNQMEEVISKVRAYNDFKEENDPYGEHDFGSFEYEETQVIWKFDYYDLNYKFLSPAPDNPKVTRRVLSIMLAEEY